MNELTISSDRDLFKFSKKSGFVSFSDIFIKYFDKDEFKFQIEQNYFFKQLADELKEVVLQRLLDLQKQTSVILDDISSKYHQQILSVSVAGSFSYKRDPGDLDLNVVLAGGGVFDYYENYQMRLGFPISKVSFMIFSMEDLLSIAPSNLINDTIINPDFIHQDLIAREMLVASIRNITFYGYPLLGANISLRDVLVRLGRQLYFTDKVLSGSIKRYATPMQKTQKALSRIIEAELVLKWIVEKIDRGRF